MRATHRVLCFLAAVMPVAAAAPAGAVPLLVPHRAVYELSLADSTEQSGILGLAGRMVYEFAGSVCDGYTTTFRYVTRIDTEEESRFTDQQTTSFEDGEGKSFSFVNKSFVDQKLEREVKGSATVFDDGIAVRLDKPEHKSVTLEKSQFPTGHLLELIEKARSGEHFYATTLFDGSDGGDRLMTTTVVVGDSEQAADTDPELKALDSMREDRFWPVEMAYFDLSEGNGDEVPSYRMAFKLYENGVTRDLLMDYGEFAMTGRLVKLDLFKPAGAACSQ